MWTRLRKQLTLSKLDGRRLPIPTEGIIAQFEKRNNFKLPKSYREYAKLFGVGELAGYYRIYHTVNWEGQIEPEVVPQLVFFASNFNEDVYAWNREDVRNQRNKEYGIYLIPRHEQIAFLSASFVDFVTRVCFKLGTPSESLEFIRY